MLNIRYIDLFAGASGLSEGFVREGFTPVAHVEMNSNACETIKTRIAYHYLKAEDQIDKYVSYLKNEINRKELHSMVPAALMDTVINKEISDETVHPIFEKIDSLLNGEKVDLIIGGPPCQAYSVIGRSRDPNRMEGDKRNYLFKQYAAFLKKYKPKYFVFENVRGLLTAGTYLQQMKDLFESEELGYKIQYDILDASDFGVLQTRKRVIIIGKLHDKDFKFPEFTPEPKRWKILSDLFYDLPDIGPDEKRPFMGYAKKKNEYLDSKHIRNGLDVLSQHITRPHNDRDLKIYEIAIKKWVKEGKRLHYNEIPEELKTHKNQKAFLDRFKVVDPHGCSHTMVAHIAKDGHYYIHPDLKQLRSLSVREAARIQSFPDDYYFEGGRGPAFKQIGNAVPPLMAEAIAKKIKELINE